MIIFTDDESPFRDENEVFMYGSIDTVPDRKDTTYFLHTDKFSSEDVLYWSSIVQNKLVIVTQKAPKLSKEAKELCVVHDNLNGKSNDDTFLTVKAIINWADRERVATIFKSPPIALLLWFLRGNYTDIDFWRRIAKVQYNLPEDYLKASIIYGVKPSRKRVVWPKKKAKSKERPEIFKADDKHWEVISTNSISVANKIRASGDIPKGMARRKVASQKWF